MCPQVDPSKVHILQKVLTVSPAEDDGLSIRASVWEVPLSADVVTRAVKVGSMRDLETVLKVPVAPTSGVAC